MDRLCIDVLIRSESFSSSFLRLLGEEELRCKDVHRITALIDVSLGLLSPEFAGQEVRLMATVNLSWSHCSQLSVRLAIAGSVEIRLQAFDASLSTSPEVNC